MLDIPRSYVRSRNIPKAYVLFWNYSRNVHSILECIPKAYVRFQNLPKPYVRYWNARFMMVFKMLNIPKSYVCFWNNSSIVRMILEYSDIICTIPEYFDNLKAHSSLNSSISPTKISWKKKRVAQF